MKILVTGAAGFIGLHLCKLLLAKGYVVVGLDNINDYYDPQLKLDRLSQLGIPEKEAQMFSKKVQSTAHGEHFTFVRSSLDDSNSLSKIFGEENFDVVCNLAAQVGVRYSLENPRAYIDSNIVGFLNILECCKNHKIKHLVYASSSSVYGLNDKIPFSVHDNVDHPISIYAASKKSNELMAHTYSHLYGLSTTGLRFFTVYGPWGRPDMAMFLFTDAIANDKPLKVFNHGHMKRDFTYVKDIAEGVVQVLTQDVTERKETNQLYKIYNIGNTQSINLIDFIKEIEKQLGKKAKMEMLPLQPGDIENTWANVDDLVEDYQYRPNTPIEVGVKNFVDWYRHYFN
ncbi:NAD-dependent epimerase/dehydratase family protein [Allomuricauda sp. SCSIO 65647]|uniref:NAD-dependent epimerase/dehydratase family protein n=1 Tax=Allomuricauda sp. SCSIO 65647 TaxID=2908843 RepID=UPI001F24DE4B|nr:NAD-dependent epimerase/dehydratase family protein [Muricauda sp. SCSIO 65647]UJH67031.1 NAD-dependent epimerase/dehydratase family protein [Muricauda sp. SCSIO 65647]